MDEFRLVGKVVVLTGAAGIVGNQIVKAFIEAGARVFAIDRDASALEKSLGPLHASLVTCETDISNPVAVKTRFLFCRRIGVSLMHC